MVLTDVRILYFGVNKAIVGYGDVLRIDVTMQERAGKSGTLVLTPLLGNFSGPDLEWWWYGYSALEVTLSAFETKAISYYLYVPDDSDVKDIMVTLDSPDLLTGFDFMTQYNIITVVPELQVVDIRAVSPDKSSYIYGETMALDITLKNMQSSSNDMFVQIFVGNADTGSWWKYPDTWIALLPDQERTITNYLTIPDDPGVIDIRVRVYDTGLEDKYDELIRYNVLTVTSPPPPTHAQVELMNTSQSTFSPRLGYSIRPAGLTLWKDAPIVTGASFSGGGYQTIDTGHVDVPINVHGRVYAWITAYDPNNVELARVGGPGDESVYFDVP